MLLGAIDIGSNAIRFLVSSAENYGGTWHFQRVEYLRYPLRLGEDVFTTKEISEIKINKLVKMLDAFKIMFEVFEVKGFMACATSAMRDASNGKEVVDLVLKETGIQIEIIAGQREADIIDKTIIKMLGTGKYLHIDVGGGSTEINFVIDQKKICSSSFNMGTVRAIHYGTDVEMFNQVKNWIDKNITDKDNITAVGTGGNIKKLHEISEVAQDEAMCFNKLVSITDAIKKMKVEDRIKVFKLNQDRADVIVPAAEIFINIMSWANIEKIIAPNVGLADGIVIDLFEKLQA